AVAAPARERAGAPAVAARSTVPPRQRGRRRGQRGRQRHRARQQRVALPRRADPHPLTLQNGAWRRPGAATTGSAGAIEAITWRVTSVPPPRFLNTVISVQIGPHGMPHQPASSEIAVNDAPFIAADSPAWTKWMSEP